MENNLEKFYRESNFIFESYGCTCSIDEKTMSDKTKTKSLVIFPNKDQKIKLAYQPKYGLVKVSEKNGATTDKDVLSELLSINEKDLKGYKKFFEKYGFLFTIDKEYLKIEEEELIYIVNRLKLSTELLSQISESQRKNYSIITKIAYSLINNKSLEIKDINYSSCPHALLQKNLNHRHGMRQIPRKYIDADKHLIAVSDYGYGEYIFDEEILSGYIRSSGYDKDVGGLVYALEINSLSAYVNYIDAPYKERILIEFFYHTFHRTRGLTSYKYETSKLNDGEMNLSKLDNEFKKTALEAAKIILSEEISHYIKNIHPVYDSITMGAAWQVDSLISALYYSLFFINPNNQIVRRCANINCNRHVYFSVPRTSSKKIYCTPECCRNVQQRKHREKKIKLTQNEASN